jgi:hypothetical protein
VSKALAESDTFSRGGFSEVCRTLGNTEYLVFVDDFHYIPRDVQTAVAQQIKAAAGKGVRFCIASVPHRSEDVVRSNPELRGRVTPIDFKYWNRDAIAKIPEMGFRVLNARMEPDITERMCTEALGSPQLMQSLCLETCFTLGLREEAPAPRPVTLSVEEFHRVMAAVAGKVNFRMLAEAVLAGRAQRGTKRKNYVYKKGGKGDIYKCVITALVTTPPLLSISIPEIVARIEELCDREVPPRQNIIDTCRRIAEICNEKALRGELVLEWNETSDRIEVLDPFFLFYIRRVNRGDIRY